MRPSIGLAARIFRAWKHLETETGETVTQTRLGDLVGAELGLPKPITQPSVKEWLDKGVRDVDTLWGIAQATGVRFGWLAVGELPMVAPRSGARDAGAIEENPLPRRTAEEFEADTGTPAVADKPAAGARKKVAGGGATRRPGRR